MLGSTEAAMLRFSTGDGSAPMAVKLHAELLSNPALPSKYAAGGKTTPIMLADVVVSRNVQQNKHIGTSLLSICYNDPHPDKHHLHVLRSPLRPQERSVPLTEHQNSGLQSRSVAASALEGASAVEGYVPRKHASSFVTTAIRTEDNVVQVQRVRISLIQTHHCILA
jgi:hypothetical protein